MSALDIASATQSHSATNPFDSAQRIVETGRKNDCFKKFEDFAPAGRVHVPS
jgi:hypothetical protein